MVKSINILDKEYLKWVEELAKRYRSSQIKASIKINTEQLKYNWMLGRDIVEMKVEQRWGESVIVQLSKDLRKALPNVQGLSKSNIYYCRKFYLLYNPHNNFFQQVVGIMILYLCHYYDFVLFSVIFLFILYYSIRNRPRFLLAVTDSRRLFSCHRQHEVSKRDNLSWFISI